MTHPPNPRPAPGPARTPRRVALLLACVAAAGCRGPRVVPGEALEPRAHAVVAAAASPAQRIRAANATARAVSSFSAACRLSLVTPGGRGVSLDGALAAAEGPAGRRLRVQGWKFDRPALDLTVTPTGRWLFVRGRRDAAPEGLASLPPGGFPTLAPLLSELPEAGFARAGEDRFAWPMAAFGVRANTWLIATLDGDRVVTLEVAAGELTPEAGTAGGPGPLAPGGVFQVVRFANFRSVGGVAWPMDWAFEGAFEGTALLEEVELDPGLPAAAFEPPAAARRF